MTRPTLDQFLDELWREYVSTNPPALKIYQLFESSGDKVINDHIAFRTFDHAAIDVDRFGSVFESYGYTEGGDYHFKKKKLYAKHFEHPDPTMPLIFVSQLITSEFDEHIQAIIKSLVDQLPEAFSNDLKFVYSGTPWRLEYAEYLKLKEVSEYAAWMSAFGFRVNHFTVSINHLSNFDGIQEVNQFLKDNGYELNSAGGEIKGTAEDLLEQSSTIAYNTEVDFMDGKHIIPACYYEFAKRYQNPDGQLFRGFVTGSADKIFESTDKGQDIK